MDVGLAAIVLGNLTHDGNRGLRLDDGDFATQGGDPVSPPLALRTLFRVVIHQPGPSGGGTLVGGGRQDRGNVLGNGRGGGGGAGHRNAEAADGVVGKGLLQPQPQLAAGQRRAEFENGMVVAPLPGRDSPPGIATGVAINRISHLKPGLLVTRAGADKPSNLGARQRRDQLAPGRFRVHVLPHRLPLGVQNHQPKSVQTLLQAIVGAVPDDDP